MNFKECIQRLDKKRIIMSALLFALCFALLLAFWNQPCFVSDEAEIFMHGQAIASGKLLYRDTVSQHMPVMYYIAALFSLLGADSILSFRICFYALMAFLFALIYFIYGNEKNKPGLFLFPLVFILLITEIKWKASVLSDQFQGIGMAILLLEFISFVESRSLSLKSSIIISLAVFISFGSAFVSIFAVFIMAILVLSYDISLCVIDKENTKSAAVMLAKKYGLLFGVVLAPFVILILIYLFTGRLDDFINWAYKINVDIYPKYLGYGSSIIEGLFGGFKYIFEFIEDLALFSMDATDILRFSALFFTVLFIVKFSRGGRLPLLRGIGVFLFIGACATRGLFDFHGTPALMVLALCSALSIGELIPRLQKASALLTTAAVVLIFAIASPYGSSILPNLPDITNKQAIEDFERDLTVIYVDAITEDGERVGFSTLDCDVMVMAGVIPASSHAGSVPWFWEMSGEAAMAELKESPPRVFLFNEYQSVWSYAIKDYAPDLYGFIKDNYVQLSQSETPDVWVLKSYYNDARLIISGLD